MIREFEPVTEGILGLVDEWVPILVTLDNSVVSTPRNNQQRNIRQIVGHMIDSASNNLHRIVHLQYQECPFAYPNYATHGNNDRWIAIQHYQKEDWNLLVNLWKYSNLHIVHVISHVDASRLENQWAAGDNQRVSLREGIVDYLRHLRLHMGEIEILIRIAAPSIS